MNEMHLHIVSFTVPYPPNYGGVIDVFFKIRALHAAGVKIHLHCFTYDRKPAPELEELCHEIQYYVRQTGLISALTWKPYIVYSRRSPRLLKNLLKDDYPILFEGLHSCYYLSHEKLRNRVKIYRESNIEHQYYYHLSKAEKNILKKLYYILSSLKLRTFQSTLSHASMMLTVSKEDNEYLSGRFPSVDVRYLPSFHNNDEINILPGISDYALYQGNLSVPENVKAVEYLVKEVLPGSGVRLVIAGLDPRPGMVKLLSRYADITLVPNPTDLQMADLIRNAQVNIMVTFQPTGLKLKLLYSLFSGRHCLVNPEMVAGTELGSLCEIAETPRQFKQKILELMKEPFSEQAVLFRTERLLRFHSNRQNCKTLVDLLYLHPHARR